MRAGRERDLYRPALETTTHMEGCRDQNRPTRMKYSPNDLARGSMKILGRVCPGRWMGLFRMA
jgi:hypothetical protein